MTFGRFVVSAVVAVTTGGVAWSRGVGTAVSTTLELRLKDVDKIILVQLVRGFSVEQMLFFCIHLSLFLFPLIIIGS